MRPTAAPHSPPRSPSARANSHCRIVEVRLGGGSASSRSTSIRAIRALSGRPSVAAACSSARQNIGSRLIDVSCPAMVTDRLVGMPKRINSVRSGRSPQGRSSARGYARKPSRRMPASGVCKAKQESHQYMCWPPLIDSVDPVTNPAFSSTRNATPRAISSALPSRFTGIFAMILPSTSCGTAATMSVSM